MPYVKHDAASRGYVKRSGHVPYESLTSAISWECKSCETRPLLFYNRKHRLRSLIHVLYI